MLLHNPKIIKPIMNLRIKLYKLSSHIELFIFVRKIWEIRVLSFLYPNISIKKPNQNNF